MIFNPHNPHRRLHSVFPFFSFFYKTRFNVFLFFQRFLFKKTLNSRCENNGILKHLCTKTENQSAAHKILADFVFRFTYF